MLTISSTTKIFLCMTPIDKSRSFDSLAGIVADAMGHDSFTGDFFVFRNREVPKSKSCIGIVMGTPSGASGSRKTRSNYQLRLPDFRLKPPNL